MLSLTSLKFIHNAHCIKIQLLRHTKHILQYKCHHKHRNSVYCDNHITTLSKSGENNEYLHVKRRCACTSHYGLRIFHLCSCIIWNLPLINILQPIPVAAQSKAWFCGCSLAGTAGSNPAGGKTMYFLNVVCCQVKVSSTGRSIVQSPTECGVSECDLETSTMRRPRSTGAVELGKK
jgi:hypothetical protein